MKAACILICLTLPHVIVGNIFRQQRQQQQWQHPQMKQVVQPLDLIDQYHYKPTSSDSDSHSQERSKETNQDIASYIQKYVEVLKYPEQNDKYNVKNQQRNKDQRNKHQQQRNKQQILNNEEYYTQFRVNSLEQDKEKRNIKMPNWDIRLNSEELKQQGKDQHYMKMQPLNNQFNMEEQIKRLNNIFNTDDIKKQDNEQRYNTMQRLNTPSNSEEQIKKQDNEQRYNTMQRLNTPSNSEEQIKKQDNEQRYNTMQRLNTPFNSEEQIKKQNNEQRYNTMQRLNTPSNSEEQIKKQNNEQRYNTMQRLNTPFNSEEQIKKQDNEQRYNTMQRLNTPFNSEEQIKKQDNEQRLNTQVNSEEIKKQDNDQQQRSLKKQWVNTQVNSDELNNQKDMRGKDSVERINIEQYNPNGFKFQKVITFGDDSKELVNIQKSLNGWQIPTFGDSVNWNGVVMAVGANSPVNEKEDLEKIFGDAYKTMQHISEEKKMNNHKNYEVAALTENEDARLSATELLQKYEYPVEEHTVQTDDGYILTLLRIPPKQQTRDVQKRQVVFMMHSILGSADDWLLLGAGRGLAYMLSDAGYDVWLGNARGNKYSRRHVSKHPALPEFWQFSNDEIALHDVPAMIDFVLQKTQQEKLHYIGHSAGATSFFALAAARPAYNEKIITMHALSPMVYMSHVRSPLLRMIAPGSEFSERLSQLLGRGEFRPSEELLSTLGGAMIEKGVGCKNVTTNVNFVMSGINMDEVDTSLIPVAMRHMPAGASVRQVKHFGQAVTSKEFRMYDHGTERNQAVYGSVNPTKYELGSVSAPVAIYFSEEDWLSHPVDVERLSKELPAVTDYFKVPVDHFGAMDFLLARSAPEVVYKRIIDSIQKNTAY